MACAGIDFGNRNSVVAIARRGGIDVCANEVSNRATPSLISFQSDERHIGESAASMAAQNHRNTVCSLQRLIGVPYGNKFVEEEKSRLTCQLLEHPTTKSSAVSVNYNGVEIDAKDRDVNNEYNTIFSFESLCAMLLSKLLETANIENKAPVRDLVISVPCYYSNLQRQSILNSCKIANINILRILNEHSAIALSYGIFRTKELPDTNPVKVAFVDIGEASTTVSIAAFTNTKCDILSVASDPNLGGRDLDDIIVNKFVENFKATYGIDVLSKPKPTLRLKKEAEKIKKILSANPEAPLNIECLMNDIDVKGHITRDELETIAKPLLEKVEKVCLKAIEDAKLPKDETLFAVELVGGSTRVPCFKSTVSDLFAKMNTPLRTTLNADECIARGCALMSAMLSPTFKVRDYNLTDIAINKILVDKVFTDGTATETLTLVPSHNPIPCVKVMKFKAPGALTVNMKYDDVTNLPAASTDSNVCCGYLIDAPNDQEAKVHAKIRVTGSGTIEMASAQLVKEVEVEEEVVVTKKDDSQSTTTDAKKPIDKEGDVAKANGNQDKDASMPDTNASNNEDENAKENGDGDKKESEGPKADKMETDEDKKDGKEEVKGKKEDEKEKAPEPVVTEKRMVKQKKFTDLAITPLDVGGCGMSVDLLLAATEKEGKMKAHDLYIRERSEAMNSLEAYVYDLRSRIDEYTGDLKEYGSKDVRSTLKKDLDQTEDWIYSESAEKASKSMFVEKKKGLMEKAYGMLMRKKEEDERPVRIKVLEASMDNYKQIAVGDAEAYAHIKQEEKEKMLKCVEEAGIWLKNERNKQEGIPKNADPSLTCELLYSKLKEIEGVCEPIKNTPKPAPPKKEEAKKDENENVDGKATEGKAKEENVGEDKMDTEELGKEDESSSGKGEDQGKGDGMTNGESKADEEMKEQ